MFFFLILFLTLRNGCAVIQQCSLADVKSLLEGCDRLSGLNITSTGGTMVNDHNCDILLPKQVFLDEPLFQYSLADSKKFYTIIMLDPDSPPQMEGEFFLHMLKSNIPVLVNAGKCHNVRPRWTPKPILIKLVHRVQFDPTYQGLALKARESSKTVGIDYRAYKPPTPPRGSGTHRYMSLLYEQTDGNNFLPSVPTSRGRFNLANWLRGKALCGPVAAIQFRSQF